MQDQPGDPFRAVAGRPARVPAAHFPLVASWAMP